jgi:hypothetical protein
MKGLTPTEIEKLAKLLGMMGSSFAGERAAAAAKASEFLRERGLQWSHIIGTAPAPESEPQPLPQPPPWRPTTQAEWRWWWRVHWRSKLPLCVAADDYGQLTNWERSFVHTLSQWRGTPTDAQLRSLSKLVARLEDILQRKTA